MKLIVKTETTDLSCFAFYKEPMLELAIEENRLPLIRRLLKYYNLRLNDLKFNQYTASNNYIHFSKMYLGSFLDVSFGLEEFSAKLRRHLNEEKIPEAFSELFNCLGDNAISSLRILIQQQLSTEGDANLFLSQLNPHTPTSFESLLSGKGVSYTLKIQDHNLTIFATVTNSILIDGGLFLSVELEFFPYNDNFIDVLTVAKDHYDFVLNGLSLDLRIEV